VAIAFAEPDLGLPTDGLDRGGELFQTQLEVPTDSGRILVGPGPFDQGTPGMGIASSLNLSLRHEVARLIVWHVVTRPVVPSAVSYADVREGNAPYRACGHGTHSHSTGT